ncbi:Nucleolar protein of 40 kDa [Entomortierella chlamydospora]|nr:Nucleolar protein of 40 kDa [Entomortierella chlamydospora]
MESQQAAFEKFKAAGAGKKFSHERRNAEGTSSVIEGPVPDLYSIHHGKVIRIEDFGAFVQIPGYKRHGLVFKNQASKHFTQHVSDVVAVGDQVWVKVTSTQDNKIALSMKYVSQGDGTDLDPNLVQFTEEQDKKRVHSGFVDKRPISVEDGGVLLKTVCKKCGAAGHLATECFSGGERFDLLEDDDDDDQGVVRATRPSADGKEKRKKDKHESKGKDKHREKSKDKDRHRHGDYDREKEKESRRDHRDRNESSSHRKEKRRDRSRSPKRRSDGPRVTKVESLEDALAVMRARKHRHRNDSSEESAEEKRERKRSDRKRRSHSRSRSRSPRRSDDRYDRRR